MKRDFLRKNVDCLEHKLHRQQRVLESTDSQIRKLERDLTTMKDTYHSIFSEIDTSMHCSPGSRKTRKGAELAREEALVEARENSRVEEEERQAVSVRRGYEKTCSSNNSPDILDSSHIFISFLNTCLPLYDNSLYAQSWLLKHYSHAPLKLAHSSSIFAADTCMYSLRLAPQCFTFTSTFCLY